MKFLCWIKLIWNAKWGNKTSAFFSGGYWIFTDYVDTRNLYRYFDHKHEFYNSSAGSAILNECIHCGIIREC